MLITFIVILVIIAYSLFFLRHLNELVPTILQNIWKYFFIFFFLFCIWKHWADICSCTILTYVSVHIIIHFIIKMVLKQAPSWCLLVVKTSKNTIFCDEYHFIKMRKSLWRHFYIHMYWHRCSDNIFTHSFSMISTIFNLSFLKLFKKNNFRDEKE